jgi:hypothetical protein
VVIRPYWMLSCTSERPCSRANLQGGSLERRATGCSSEALSWISFIIPHQQPGGLRVRCQQRRETLGIAARHAAFGGNAVDPDMPLPRHPSRDRAVFAPDPRLCTVPRWPRAAAELTVV